MTQSAAPEGPIPVTLVTGFLGAGKTTLINHILTQQSGLRFAVIVNEFGAIGIDHDLIISSSETLLELSNGCVCCTIRSDLVTSLRGLLANGRRFDGIFVETTGLADPAPVVQTFMFDQILAAKAYLDSVVTLVDAGHISAQLGQYAEVSNQLLLATIIIINKADTIDAVTLSGIREQIGRLNPVAKPYVTKRAQMPLDALTGQRGFDPVRIADELAVHARQPASAVSHAHALSSLSFRADQPFALEVLEARLTGIMQKYGQDIVRMKGIFDIAGQDDRLVFQAVHMMSEAVWQGVWHPGQTRQSRLVVIGQNLDDPQMQREFEWFQVATADISH
ncbi:MAG: GTP-binding protein [Candidatus Puniceispirillum sp.]